MYISGDIRTFEKRLHAAPTGINDLELFQLEALNNGYTGLAYISKNTKNHWSDQYIKHAQVFNFNTGNVFP